MVAITTPNPTHLPVRHRRALEAVPQRAPLDRGRALGLVATALVALVVVLALGYLFASPATTPGSGAAPTLDAHVVAEGETMWSIAQEIAPAGEAAPYVERLVAANGGADIAAGQVLSVPVP